MTAKEMFEALGYEQKTQDNVIWYLDIKNDSAIAFDIKEKYYWTYDGYDPLNINIKLHNAITQKMKELGWIE